MADLSVYEMHSEVVKDTNFMHYQILRGFIDKISSLLH